MIGCWSLLGFREGLLAASCPDTESGGEIHLASVYRQLRHNTCDKPEAYLSYARLAFAAGRISESLWSARAAKAKSGAAAVAEEADLYAGYSLARMKRYEEAIIVLRPLVFTSKSEFSARAHLLLVHIYRRKDGGESRNVRYLAGLFRKYHPKSGLLPLLNAP